MIVTTEQSFSKLKILDKPIDEYTDEELEAKLETLRASRGRLTTKKPRAAKAATKPKTPKSSPTLDDFDNIAE